METPGERPVIRSERRFDGVKKTLSVNVSWAATHGVIVQSPARATKGNAIRQIARSHLVIIWTDRRDPLFITTCLFSILQAGVAVGPKRMGHPGRHLIEQQ